MEITIKYYWTTVGTVTQKEKTCYLRLEFCLEYLQFADHSMIRNERNHSEILRNSLKHFSNIEIGGKPDSVY